MVDAADDQVAPGTRELRGALPMAWKPTREQIAAAVGRRVPDVIAPGLKVLFCGINPGLYSAAVGHHFARPGNRFWPALHAAGFTDRLLSPFDERDLLPRGYGVTNIVARATAGAAELSVAELVAGARRLVRKLRRYRPAFVAFLGISAYRTAFQSNGAGLGRQPGPLAGSASWVLPNPSGLNAHYQRAGLAHLFAELRRAAEG
jgi:TDG/mug DNA glycosylase family protein